MSKYLKEESKFLGVQRREGIFKMARTIKMC